MASQQAEELLAYINSLLNLFLVNEQNFPSAQGKMRYNPLDFQALRYVSAHPDCRGAEIARALSVAPTTLQSALDRMIRNGLIERRDHPKDRRGKIHRLTKEGQSLRQAILSQDMENMEFLLGALSAEERVEILRMLGKVHRQVESLNNPV
ncbi:MAG: MarR family winged helix-turn-helix transcriptional regulator [Acidobacteriota bacterium]